MLWHLQFCVLKCVYVGVLKHVNENVGVSVNVCEYACVSPGERGVCCARLACTLLRPSMRTLGPTICPDVHLPSPMEAARFLLQWAHQHQDG